MKFCLITAFLFGSTMALADIVEAPANGYASDQWLTSAKTWADERDRRKSEIENYLEDQNPDRADSYGFRAGHTPALAWNWFDRHPVGFNGVPLVLLKTLMSLDPATETDPHLLPLARIWRQPSPVPSEDGLFTLDHLGAGPHYTDYTNGLAIAAGERRHPLPNGFVFDPTVEPTEVRALGARLFSMRWLNRTTLARSALRKMLFGEDIDYQNEVEKFQIPPKVDAVFFSCSACHNGRVVVDGEIDSAGNTVRRGRIEFLPGMPNTEIEAQHFSEMMLQTGEALVESGFAHNTVGLPQPGDIEPAKKVIRALLVRMINRARDEESLPGIYGPSAKEIRRARLQTYWVAKDFSTHITNLIGTAVKTQYIYQQVGGTYAYGPSTSAQSVPDMMNHRPGQMDAFGAASGLVALHTKRPDNSYISFMAEDFPDNPLFTGIATLPGFESSAGPEAAAKRIFENVATWAPTVPAPIDIKSLNWAGQRVHANWDGNQGAAARALASGTSATGSPLETNVRIHEPLNPFINNLPPPPYPFEIDREKGQRGYGIFQRERCATCHSPRNAMIFPASKLGVDPNRSLLTSEVAQLGLAGLVLEACRIFIRKNPGNDWCLPRAADGKVITDTKVAYDEYFRDIPKRIRDGRNGYKADMLHGIWARAPYLHNGSVPTLLHLMCPDTRPTTFLRGNLYYDERMVGFEWAIRPKERYSPHDSLNVKDYNTKDSGRSNGGHDFLSDLCPDTSDLDPIADREEIEKRVLESEIGDLLEYLKTL